MSTDKETETRVGLSELATRLNVSHKVKLKPDFDGNAKENIFHIRYNYSLSTLSLRFLTVHKSLHTRDIFILCNISTDKIFKPRLRLNIDPLQVKQA